ncbi:MAG TPA: hypothetical protein VFE54_13570 [Mucilaginibacter sp.]|jgi:hypothetical protein|nr:hypothetical protein [Mucilaginibacter sp.]
MSWDIVIFNYSEKIASPEDIDDSKLAPTDFFTAFASYFKNIIEDGNHREIKGNDYSIDYFFVGDLTSNIMLSLYGESALYPLIDLAVKNGWQIFDTGTGEMIDLENPAQNGYKDFQTYLAQVLKTKNSL